MTLKEPSLEDLNRRKRGVFALIRRTDKKGDSNDVEIFTRLIKAHGGRPSFYPPTGVYSFAELKDINETFSSTLPSSKIK